LANSHGSATKSSPIVSDGLIYFGTDKGSLIACDTEGKLAWKTAAGDPIEAPPLVSDNNVIYSTSEGILYAANKKTGKIVWSYKTDNQIVGSANIWKSGNSSGIIVGSYDYYLHCINPSTGKMLWRVETENYINGTPAILNGKIIFGGCDGMLRVIPLDLVSWNNFKNLWFELISKR